MPYLVLGIAVLIGLVLIVKGVAGLNPMRAFKVLLGVAVLGAIGAFLYLVASRGLGTLMFVLAFLLPTLLRWRAAKQFFRNLGGPSPGQATGVNTKYLRMSLDHDSGILDGTVLEGNFKGRRLGELAQAELLDLLQECRVNDEESAQVLEAYLDRVHGASWRGGASGDHAGNNSDANSAGGTPWGGGMTREEAFEILNISPGATPEEIKEAHHALMKKIHPDQGGSNYLASKINQAKELLLGD
ncbi:MAG: molecular chaperone DnaJ [Rhodospirillaceae bacterium]|nr:molecular chaperone DnaJ [Rhodospirillaceae bacterium]|tara:strand:+ start:1326 stop:2054 length:729 start_codon:yes stop_codon:yes gene_type:complete